jgi:hypothetical protein
MALRRNLAAKAASSVPPLEPKTANGKKVRTPGYLKHKPTGQAYVRINGKQHYLGTYNSAASKKEDRRMIKQWKRSACTKSFGKTHCAPLAMIMLDVLTRRFWWSR